MTRIVYDEKLRTYTTYLQIQDDIITDGQFGDIEVAVKELIASNTSYNGFELKAEDIPFFLLQVVAETKEFRIDNPFAKQCKCKGCHCGKK